MPFTGLNVLRDTMRLARQIASGKTAETMRETISDAAMKLATKAWDAKTAPSGKAWRPSMLGTVPSLEQSGAMRKAFKAQRSPKGFALIDRVANPKTGKWYGGSHAYGRTYHRNGNKWRLPARPFVPNRGVLPPEWEREFKAAADLAMRR